MTVPLVSELQAQAPPIVGRFYLVPAVYMERFYGRPAMWWPVHGQLHEDKEHFNFEPLHYHVDQRFLTRKNVTQLGDHDDIRGLGPIGRSFTQPVHAPFAHLKYRPEADKLPPEPELRRMRCMRAMPDLPYLFAGTKLHAAYAGTQCRRGRLGLVCPHKQYPLGQSVADADGIITCPLHGLRVRASDGVVLPKLAPKTGREE